MPRARVKKETPPPEVYGEEYIKSLRALFQEGIAKGQFKTPADLALLKAPIVARMVAGNSMSKVKARSTHPIKFPDGSEPSTTLAYTPATFKITSTLREKLMRARKWEAFVVMVEDAMNPEIKKARRKAKMEEKQRQEEMIVEAAMAGEGYAQGSEDQSQQQDHENRGMGPSQGHGSNVCHAEPASQLAQMAEGGLKNYGFSAIGSQDVGQEQEECPEDSLLRKLGFQSPTVGYSQTITDMNSVSRPSLEENGSLHRGKSQAATRRRGKYILSDPATPSTDSEAESDIGSSGEEELPSEDDPLLFTIECLASEIEHLPGDSWHRSRRKLIQLEREESTKNLGFEALLGKVVGIVMQPVEFGALVRRQWDMLDAAVRVCARVAEVIAGDEESAEAWAQQKMRDWVWWKAAMGDEDENRTVA